MIASPSLESKPEREEEKQPQPEEIEMEQPPVVQDDLILDNADMNQEVAEAN